MTRRQRECAPSGALDVSEQQPLFPPGSKRQLRKFLKNYVGLQVPSVRVCGHHAAPMDYLWYAYNRDKVCKDTSMQVCKDTSGIRLAADAGFNNSLAASGEAPLAGGELDLNCGRDARVPRNGDCIVWANRAGGKTQLAAVASLLEGLFKPGCQTRILSGSLAQSGRMYGYLRDFVHWKFPELLDGKLLKESCRFVNGTAVEILSQSSRSVRGQHVHKLRCDEVELFDADVLHAAKFITQSTGGKVAAMAVRQLKKYFEILPLSP